MADRYNRTTIKKARTPEQAENRRTEILRACEQIYDTRGYDDVTFKAISEMTTFSRPTIYNYYHSREELLLDLLQRECLEWAQNMKQRFHDRASLSTTELASVLVDSMEGREKLLSLFALHYKSLELTCEPFILEQFHINIQPLYETLNKLYTKCVPDSTMEQMERFRILLFSLVSGFYPIMQMEASRKAAEKQPYCDFGHVLLTGVCSLIGNRDTALL